MTSFSYQYVSYMLFYRCDAKWDNLDDNIAGWCSHRLMCSLVVALDKKNYGMTMALLVTSWYVIASYKTPASPYHVFISCLPMAFLVQTFMSCYPWTFSNKSLKAHSRITWLPGLQLISILSTLWLKLNRFLLTLTDGKSSHG